MADKKRNCSEKTELSSVFLFALPNKVKKRILKNGKSPVFMRFTEVIQYEKKNRRPQKIISL
jgi:hypothetical protein